MKAIDYVAQNSVSRVAVALALEDWRQLAPDMKEPTEDELRTYILRAKESGAGDFFAMARAAVNEFIEVMRDGKEQEDE